MNAENRTMLAMLFTFFACICVCMVTIFLVATMTIRAHATEPLYRITPLNSYPAPAPAPWQPVPVPEPIGPPLLKD